MHLNLINNKLNNNNIFYYILNKGKTFSCKNSKVPF